MRIESLVPIILPRTKSSFKGPACLWILRPWPQPPHFSPLGYVSCSVYWVKRLRWFKNLPECVHLCTHAIHVLIQPFPLDNTGQSWWDYCLLLLPLLPVAECSQRLLTSQMLRSWSILIFRIISGYFSRYLSICPVWCLLRLQCDTHTHTHTHTQWVSICNKMSYYIYDVRKDNSL